VVEVPAPGASGDPMRVADDPMKAVDRAR